MFLTGFFAKHGSDAPLKVVIDVSHHHKCLFRFHSYDCLAKGKQNVWQVPFHPTLHMVFKTSYPWQCVHNQGLLAAHLCSPHQLILHYPSGSTVLWLGVCCVHSPAVLCGIYPALGGETGAGRSWFTPKRCPRCPLSCLALMQAGSLHCSPPQSLLSKELSAGLKAANICDLLHKIQQSLSPRLLSS